MLNVIKLFNQIVDADADGDETNLISLEMFYL